MDARVRRVREESDQRTRGTWFSPAARGEALAFARDGIGRGRRLADLARELTVSPESLRRWLARDPLFRPVAVQEANPPLAGSRGGFVLHTAAGHRLEGLTLPDAITVLRALEVCA